MKISQTLARVVHPREYRNRSARYVTWAIIGVNALLLVVSLTDYRVSIDAGYHISLARWYAAHGSAWWDHINFGPGGRPNMQGPALHVAIALLGLILGNTPDSFILANAILGVAQWTAAMLTALYFARRLSGDIAAMFAVALLAGSAFAAGSFYVGIPSGWLFISIPWAIYFFLEDQLVVASLITSAACYMHIGGFLTVPVGILIAAILERRWHSLFVVGVATAILTSPYSIHLLMNFAWYRGVHGHEAMRLDPLTDLLAIVGLIWLLRDPMRHKFLLAWAGAPLSWLIQDPNRFVAQSTLAGSVIAGLFLADMMARIGARGLRIAFASTLVGLATFFPLGIPSLVAEASWDAGLKFPLAEDWNDARDVAAVVERNHLNGRLLSVYETSFAPAIAVFTPVVLYRGHWVEVQPIHDPADDISAGAQTYVVPLAPGDPVLTSMSQLGLVRVYGGNSDLAVIDLPKATNPKLIEPQVAKILADNAEWLGENAVNNTMPEVAELRHLLRKSALVARRIKMDQQRFRAGRMEIACLVYGYAIENDAPQSAHKLRNAARGFGSMASFLSDGDPVGYIGDARHAQFKTNMLALAAAIRESPQGSLGTPQVRSVFGKLFDDYFGASA